MCPCQLCGGPVSLFGGGVCPPCTQFIEHIGADTQPERVHSWGCQNNGFFLVCPCTWSSPRHSNFSL